MDGLGATFSKQSAAFGGCYVFISSDRDGCLLHCAHHCGFEKGVAGSCISNHVSRQYNTDTIDAMMLYDILIFIETFILLVSRTSRTFQLARGGGGGGGPRDPIGFAVRLGGTGGGGGFLATDDATESNEVPAITGGDGRLPAVPFGKLGELWEFPSVASGTVIKKDNL
jgi:hypothetical protein